MQLILLSAGRGSRLSKKLRKSPKSLVKVNGKSIIDHNISFFKKFKDKFIITGYKKNLLSDFANKNNFKIIYNKKFQSTNMVYSMFLSSKFINQDVLICYGDIIFDHKIFNLFKEKKDIMPLNVNWFKNWKKRMSKQKIKDDAEDVIIKNNCLHSIGGRIENKYPRYQYMGLFKFKKSTFFKLKKYFKKINKKKIDMTTFLNLSISEKNIKFSIKKYKSFWYEIDSDKDLKVASREIK